MEQVRSFIAIELPQEVKAALSRLAAGLMAKNAAPAKWVEPEGIHLTLKFLGGVAAEKLESIIAAMQTAARGIKPFRLELDGLGAFPGLARAQVVWVGLRGDLSSLTRLQQNIEANVSPLGFPSEARPFHPHLTLARVREQALPAERQKLGELIAASSFAFPGAFEVGSVSLMRSQLTRQGAIYSRIASVKLG